MDYHGEFRVYVMRAIAKKADISFAKAKSLVEKSALGALMKGNQGYVIYKGANYWADRILEDCKAP